MTTIFAFGDSHGLMPSNDLLAVMDCCDYIVFVGDGSVELSDACKTRFGGRYIEVKGNCDHTNLPDYYTLEIENVRILMAHGHTLGVKSGLINTVYYALEQKFDAVIFGHTHRFLFTKEKGIDIINVGSLGNSFFGDNGYTFITVDSQNFFAKFVKTA